MLPARPRHWGRRCCSRAARTTETEGREEVVAVSEKRRAVAPPRLLRGQSALRTPGRERDPEGEERRAGPSAAFPEPSGRGAPRGRRLSAGPGRPGQRRCGRVPVPRPISGGGAAGPGGGGQSRRRRNGAAPGPEPINGGGPSAPTPGTTPPPPARPRPPRSWIRGVRSGPPGAGQRGSPTKGQRGAALPRPRRRPLPAWRL